MKIRPLGSKVLLKDKEAPKYFKGTSILIPDTAHNKEYLAFVIKRGKDVKNVEEGDLVKYAKHIQAIEMEHNGEDHFLIDEKDIHAIVEDD
jgi:co-chaperonin GroES (HSP10)